MIWTLYIIQIQVDSFSCMKNTCPLADTDESCLNEPLLKKTVSDFGSVQNSATASPPRPPNGAVHAFRGNKASRESYGEIGDLGSIGMLQVGAMCEKPTKFHVGKMHQQIIQPRKLPSLKLT